MLCKDTIKQAKYKIKYVIFLFSSVSIFDNYKDSRNNAMNKLNVHFLRECRVYTQTFVN